MEIYLDSPVEITNNTLSLTNTSFNFMLSFIKIIGYVCINFSYSL